MRVENTVLYSPDQGRDDSTRSLHQVVEVPGGEEDSGLVALVGVDGVMFVPTAILVVSPLAAEQPARQSG